MNARTPRNTSGRRRVTRVAIGMLVAMSTAAGALITVPAANAADGEVSAIDDDLDPTDPQQTPDPYGNIPDPPEPPYITPENGFSWRAPQRAQKWHENWRQRGASRGWAVETYNPEYVSPTNWTLSFNGCPTQAEYDQSIQGRPTVNTYSWTTNLSATPVTAKNCRTSLNFPAETVYHVTLTVTTPTNQVTKYYQPVRVEDKLVVILGDSFASGEGSPDAPISGDIYNNLYDFQNAKWVDKRCHRSAWAGGVRAAYKAEEADPHTSVTLLSFACSGATISKVRERGAGVLGSYGGIEPIDGVPALPPQVDQLQQAVAGARPRTIDSLVVMAGINDILFSDMMSECTLYLECWSEPVTNATGSTVRLDDRLLEDMALLKYGYSNIRDALARKNVKYTKAFNVEYPSAFTGNGGARCASALDDVIEIGPVDVVAVTAFLAGIGYTVTAAIAAALLVIASLVMHVDSDEVHWLDTWVKPRFSATILESATLGGFEQIKGIDQAFAGHGYCATNRYLNTATDAALTQGPYADMVEGHGLRIRSDGTLHPNQKGQDAVTNVVAPKLTPSLEVKAPKTVVGTRTMNEDGILLGFKGSAVPILRGLADDATDPNGFPLFAYGAKVNYGTVLLSGNEGSFSYKPPKDFVGTARITFTVSNGLRKTITYTDVVVGRVIDLPKAVNDFYEIYSGGTRVLGVRTNDYNPDGVPTTVSVAALPASKGVVLVWLGGTSLSYKAPVVTTRTVITFPYKLHHGANVTTAYVTMVVLPFQTPS